MKLLIVEDESRTRNLLRHYVPWEEIGISGVETAKNGQLAMDAAKVQRPDVILCDVRMPKMNGIEFAQAYRREDPLCKIIFLSAFSDKEYLKSAIHLKALSYIEKPINLEEVRRTVAEAVQQRSEELEQIRSHGLLQADPDRSLLVLRQELVRRLITDPSSGHTLTAMQHRETFLLPPAGPYTVAAASLIWTPPDHPENPALVQEYMLLELSRQPFFRSLGILSGFDATHHLVLLFHGSYGPSYKEGREVIEALQAELRAAAGPAIRLQLGIGGTAGGPEDIPRVYREAVLAVNSQFYTNGKAPVFAGSVTPGGVLDTDWNVVQSIRDGLRRGEHESVRVLIRSWTSRARAANDLDLVRVKDTYFQMLMAVMGTAVQLGFAEHPLNVERRYIWKELDRIHRLDLLEDYLLSAVDSLETTTDLSEGGTAKIRDILRFTHAHFHEKGFGIHAIAEHVKLSETYLCSYFKKQRGQTIKEFITDTRLSCAKELLRDQEMKLFEVASRLGFADANYFTTFFKRYSGMTPTEFREKQV
ncbi:response regulator [Paenibacillus sp. MMS20-IR301]|uniref:response regulator n=1 Tax=Paenibacillus sp. MMS20-IR301 TaxID=2895946 RepID=UPI0028EBCE96|nr:response regulator [Paenibacillus sp. MMS20-IR301]WNS40721.1 response regulator [Paenibacillus sp. MMS20-IR301]